MDSKLTSDRASLRWRRKARSRGEEREAKEGSSWPGFEGSAKWPYVNKSRSIYPLPPEGIPGMILRDDEILTGFSGRSTSGEGKIYIYICIYVHIYVYVYIRCSSAPVSPFYRESCDARTPAHLAYRRIPKRRFLDECASSLISFVFFRKRQKLVSDNEPGLCSLVAQDTVRTT